MQFGARSTVTIDMSSPDEAPVTAVVNQQGQIVMPNGDRYDYHAGPPEDYRRQVPGDPPGGWHTLEFDANGEVRRYEYPVETMNRIHTGTGSWSAVA